MFFTRSRTLSLFLVAVLVVAGCASEGAQTEPPEGWNTGEGQWWAEGVDTALAFRNTDSLEAMGVAGDETFAAGAEITPDQFERAVKEELAPLYRNHPEIVDSLFEEYAQPNIAEADLSGDLEEAVPQYRTESYEAISEHFREPRPQTQLGADVSVSYPDTLRSDETSGTVEMQVYLDREGAPQAIQRLEGVHPTLDAIGMNAATRMRWEPAYVLRDDDEWEPIPGWVRFSVTFQPPPGA